MKGLLQKISLNKKGVSEMVGYVLLVIIAIGISIAVFQFLRIYIPKGENPQCNQDISLIVQEYKCDFNEGKITLSLLNKGLFKVEVAYIRFGESNKKILPLINDPLKVGTANSFYLNGGLNPGSIFSSEYLVVIEEPGTYKLEVQAGVIDNSTSQAIPCKNAVITQLVECN
jgi:hypothetical protein